MKPAILLFTVIAAFAADPEFNKSGELVRPKNYREWIFLSSGVGMNYGAGPLPFSNVFVEPSAYRKFVETGKWPESTIFALEIRQPATEGSINKGGQYQTALLSVEFSVKDKTRFADGWGYFAFNGNTTSAKVLGDAAGCNACHGKNAAVEHTFVQFYPTLFDVARTKGTLNPSFK
jgi:Cytochrome P460